MTRNPLAEPGIIGVAGGAGLGAITVITLVPGVGFWTQAGFAGLGAALATTLVFTLAARGGFASERLVLIGFGVQAAAQALITLLITLTDPWNETKALTWLGGSTYGRSRRCSAASWCASRTRSAARSSPRPSCRPA